MLTLSDTNDQQRARLVIGAKNSGFSEDVQIALRYTIYRIRETIIPTLSHFLVLWMIPITMEDMRIDHDHVGMLNMFLNRAFEVSILFERHRWLLSDIVLDGISKVFSQTIEEQFMILLKAARYLDVKEPSVLDQGYETILAYVQGRKWRMLSVADRAAPPVLGSSEPQNKVIGLPLIMEVLLDRKMHQTFEDTSTAGEFKTECDYKKVSSVLRQAQYLIDIKRFPAKWDKEIEENRLLEAFE